VSRQSELLPCTVGGAAKLRVELIKAIGVQTLQELRSKADACFSDLNDWLGTQFLQEMNRCARAHAVGVSCLALNWG